MCIRPLWSSFANTSRIDKVVLVQQKNDAYKCHLKNDKNSNLFEEFQFLQTKLNLSIETSKKTYNSRISKKLIDPNSLKT